MGTGDDNQLDGGSPPGGVGPEPQPVDPPADQPPPPPARVIQHGPSNGNVARPACSTVYPNGWEVKSFDDFITLIANAETALAAGKITTPKDQIHALRGIYYGTDWSLDYATEKSKMRNEGFQRFTRPSQDPGDTIPPDVRQILCCGIFEALYKNQDVIDGASGRRVDFGHVIIGLDARFDPKALTGNIIYPYTLLGMDVADFDMGATGLEVSTWVGDLGGGTGRVAVMRNGGPSPGQIAVVFDPTGSDYGDWINLEGDIAGYVVASGGATTVGPPTFASGKGLSDALREYLSPGTPGALWNNRADTFLKMNGAVIDGATNTLTNKPTLISTFATKFQVFSCNYLASRVNDQSVTHVTPDEAKKASQSVIGVSNELAEVFVNTLADSRLKGESIDAQRCVTAKHFAYPSPSAPASTGCPACEKILGYATKRDYLPHW